MTAPSGLVDLEQLADEICALARGAAAVILDCRARGIATRAKDDASPVTQADRDAETVLLKALKELAPNIHIVSEETAADRTAPLGARFFLVDPLDGTKEFIKKRSDFTVNVALIEDGFPRFGIVYAPARSLLAVTTADGVAMEAELAPDASGADLSSLKQTRLHVRAGDRSALTALVSLSHLDSETEKFLDSLNISERTGAGSSVKFLEIARGNADVYPRFGPTMEWDTAAGDAVLRAAGGKVTTIDGTPLTYGKTQIAGMRDFENPFFYALGDESLLARMAADEAA